MDGVTLMVFYGMLWPDLQFFQYICMLNITCNIAKGKGILS